MLAETIVIFACVTNPQCTDPLNPACVGHNACTDTSNAYFKENPDIKQVFDKDVEKVKDFIGPEIVDRVGPVLFVISKGSGTVKINKNWSLQANQTSGTLSWHVEF